MMSPLPTVDVVVPTYRRPDLLRRCLAGIAAQARAPRSVVVVVRADDAPTRAVVDAARVAHPGTGAPVIEVVVVDPGLLVALRAGVAATTSDVVAVVDDDAVPRPDWVARIAATFTDPAVGLVGGRPDDGRPVRPDARVGHISRWGRLVGDHDVGAGPAREIDVPIGADMAIRADALVLPRPGVLLGPGAEPHNEVLLAAWARALGYRVWYDPQIVVDHRPSADVLPAGDLARTRESDEWTFANAHNWFVGVTALGERRRSVVLAYALLVGMRGSPGIARGLVALVRRERDVVARMPATWRGVLAGFRAARRGAAERVVRAADLRRGVVP